MTNLPWFENILYRLGLAAGEAFVMWWILYMVPPEAQRIWQEWRVWKAFRQLNKQLKRFGKPKNANWTEMG